MFRYTPDAVPVCGPTTMTSCIWENVKEVGDQIPLNFDLRLYVKINRRNDDHWCVRDIANHSAPLFICCM